MSVELSTFSVPPPALPKLPAKAKENATCSTSKLSLPQLSIQTRPFVPPLPLLPLSFSIQRVNEEAAPELVTFGVSGSQKERLSAIGLDTQVLPAVFNAAGGVHAAALATLGLKWQILSERVQPDAVATCMDVTLSASENMVPILEGIRAYAFVCAWTPTRMTSNFLACQGAPKTLFKGLSEKTSTQSFLEGVGLTEKMGACVMSYLQEPLVNLLIARAFPTGDQIIFTEEGATTVLGKPSSSTFIEGYQGCMGLDNYYFIRIFEGASL